MKITEPKTPYVRYNAETDTVEGGACTPPLDSFRFYIISLLLTRPRTDWTLPSIYPPM